MQKADIVRARIEPQVKHHAEQVLASLGMNMSDAIRIFVNQIAIREAFPIELKTPNQITLEAMQAETQATGYDSASALFDELSHADD